MAAQELNMTAPASVYTERRRVLAAEISAPLVICGGNARPRQMPTNLHGYRGGSHFIYFGGPPVEGSALVIEPGSDGVEGVHLLRPVGDYEDAVWVGEVPGDDALASASGLPEAHFRTFEDLPGLVADRSAQYLCPPCIPTLERMAAAGISPPDETVKLQITHQRLHKDEHELEAMRRASSFTAKAFTAAMAATRPGIRESDVAGAFHAALMAEECSVSFTPIITVHGEVLHLEGYPNPLHDGDLLLVDGGAEEPGGYAADVTRTFPVSGKFGDIQVQLYETVLRAELTAVAACVPGRRYRDIHDLAARVVVEGLVDVGLLRGNVEQLLERRAHTLFFPHGVGHLLGLDAHDCEDFGDIAGYPADRSRREAFGDKYLRLDRDLSPGMVVTIEPGIYLIPAIWRTEALYRPFADCVDFPAVHALLEAEFGGIRIEDDVVVRKSGGPENLTAAIPSTVSDLERVVGGEG
ncbi:MAG: aminopeptidase P N-terminal domain-containing protein [Planctomycetota bacterium]|jgi:Xaa-Pro aminopeptidase